MNEYKKLLKNSSIFAIANLGSKLITFLLVPFYTYVLSKEQYGTIDMITTTISMLVPLITLSIFESTLRFAKKSKYDKEDILSSSVIIVIIVNLIFIFLYPLLSRIYLFRGYLNLFYLVLFSQSINTVLSQFTNGIEKLKIFALNGLINTFTTVISNIVLLAKFNMGVRGYLLSLLIANIISIIFLILAVSLWRYFSVKRWNSVLIREMLIYSIPLIPNTLMWWIMNLSDRYIVTLFLGVSTNGIYAVANKIPTILYLINSIFYQSWQHSAIEHKDSKNKSVFYSNVFNVLATMMLISTSFLLVLIRPIIKVLISSEFREAWRYVPFLLLAVVFSSFSSFLGTNYIAMKETRGASRTSAVGAILNIILNIILVPRIGLNGAAIATTLSFLTMWVLRIRDTKRFVIITFDSIKLFSTVGIIVVQVIILLLDLRANIIIQLLLGVSILVVNLKTLKQILRKLRRL